MLKGCFVEDFRERGMDMDDVGKVVKGGSGMDEGGHLLHDIGSMGTQHVAGYDLPVSISQKF